MEAEDLLQTGLKELFAGKTERAIGIFQSLTVLYPLVGWYWFRLGDALFTLSEENKTKKTNDAMLAESVTAYEQAIRLAPEDANWYLNLSHVFVALGQKKKAIGTVRIGLPQVGENKLLERRLKWLLKGHKSNEA